MLYTKPLGKKCVPSSLTRNYVFFNDKCCSATVQRAPSNKHTVKRERMTQKGILSMGLPVRIVYKDDSWNFFQMTMLFLAYVMTILRQLHFTRNKHFCRGATSREWLIQHNSYFLGVATSSEQLLSWSSYFFRTLTSFQQLFFQNSYLFGAKLLPTSNFLWICSYLGQPVFQRTATF